MGESRLRRLAELVGGVLFEADAGEFAVIDGAAEEGGAMLVGAAVGEAPGEGEVAHESAGFNGLIGEHHIHFPISHSLRQAHHDLNWVAQSKGLRLPW